jgi:hypothetical protein
MGNLSLPYQYACYPFTKPLISKPVTNGEPSEEIYRDILEYQLSGPYIILLVSALSKDGFSQTHQISALQPPERGQ